MRNPLTKIDFYKADHRRQYPEGTSVVYSNFTPRKSRIEGVNHIVFFGMQYLILSYLIHEWKTKFFNRSKELVVGNYQRRMDNALGKGAIPVDHIEALHDLGYLPLEIKALPEGTLVPMRVPCFTIRNTKPEFFWLVNYLESVISSKIWKPCTSATIAFQYRKTFERYYHETVNDNMEGSDFIKWQGHDFSYRGMSGDEDACLSGAAHLLSFWGTDTVSAIDFLEDYYFADSDKEIVGGSVPATEHSVMCMGEKAGEFETFRRLICDLYPSGMVSIVSDTWDYWQVINDYLPRLKDEILTRTGSPIGMDKVVIRPDSGDPYRIICGYFPEEVREVDGKFYLINERGEFNSIKDKPLELWEVQGTIERLWDTFGGSETPNGYRQLSPKIGVIYGDSITLSLQIKILEGMKRKGFASTNIVLGIGSFTYEYQTRDTFGFAMKATYGELEAPEEDYHGMFFQKKISREIYKDPKTDDGTKKSARGLLCVLQDKEGELVLKDRCSWKEEAEGLLIPVFRDGEMLTSTNLGEVRNRLNSYL